MNCFKSKRYHSYKFYCENDQKKEKKGRVGLGFGKVVFMKLYKGNPNGWRRDFESEFLSNNSICFFVV